MTMTKLIVGLGLTLTLTPGTGRDALPVIDFPGDPR